MNPNPVETAETDFSKVVTEDENDYEYYKYE